MSFCVEQADPLALLSELPSQWAQTCVTRPRSDESVSYLLAVLDQVWRVLREDGALWLALAGGGNSCELAQALKYTPWLRPESPRITPRQVVLLTKSTRPLLNPYRGLGAVRSRRELGRSRYSVTRPSGYRCVWHPRTRRALCVPSAGAAGVLSRQVVEWCILTSTVPYACGACGAPWTRTGALASRGCWRPGCRHNNDRGRCLVIDPFCTSGVTGAVAVRGGHHFLGVALDPADAFAARREITQAQGRP
jgi:hypothetical protein